MNELEIDDKSGKKRKDHGCFITRTVGILLALSLIFIFVGRAFSFSLKYKATNFGTRFLNFGINLIFANNKI